MGELWKGIPVIGYEGPKTDNPLSFRYYRADEAVGSSSMEDLLRFSLSFRHPSGAAAPDDDVSDVSDVSDVGDVGNVGNVGDPMELAVQRLYARFELAGKLGIRAFTFCDRDLAPEAASLRETDRRLDVLAALAKDLMQETGTRLLWGAADLGSHPRYAHGAMTSPHAEVYAFAAAQVKKAMELTHLLGGANFLFRAENEEAGTPLNTDPALMQENMARFLRMAVEYARAIGFAGKLLLRPGRSGPEAAHSFLKTYQLDRYFLLDVRAGRGAAELRAARVLGLLGSVEVGQADGRFPADVREAALAMTEILRAGGPGAGGLNLDAGLSRGSCEPEDLFYAHITAMDAYARGLLAAHRLVTDGLLDRFTEERYASWQTGLGAAIRAGKTGFSELEAFALEHDAPRVRSGRQELLESVLTSYILEA